MRGLVVSAVLLAGLLCGSGLVTGSAGPNPSVLFLLPDDGVHDGDFFPVVSILTEADVRITLASPTGDVAGTMNGESVPVDMTLGAVDVAEFDAIVKPLLEERLLRFEQNRYSLTSGGKHRVERVFKNMRFHRST